MNEYDKNNKNPNQTAINKHDFHCHDQKIAHCEIFVNSSWSAYIWVGVASHQYETQTNSEPRSSGRPSKVDCEADKAVLDI